MKASPVRQKHDQEREMTPALIFALNSSARRRILRLLDVEDLEMSPSEMAEAMEVGLSALSFHARVLRELGVTRCTRTRQVRGAFESFYVSNVAGNELVATILARTAEDDTSQCPES
jgi:DNA-binding transcriptional ArsR family regulator